MALKQLEALSEIRLTTKDGKRGDPDKGIPPVRPQIKVIRPGTVFTASNEAQQEMLVSGRPPAARFFEPPKGAMIDDDTGDDLDALRAEYEEVVGKKPGRMKAENMRAAIDEAKSKSEGSEGDDTDGMV